MTRALHRLSPLKVRTAPEGMHGDGGCLWLQVHRGVEGLTRSWVLRYTIAGRSRAMGLGPAHTVTLAEAREKAAEARKLIYRRIDPLDERQSQRASAAAEKARSVTFDVAANAYIDGHEKGWRNDVHREQWRQSIATYVSPLIGDLAVRDIGTEHVLQVLRPIWATIPETARRLRARIEAVLNFANEDPAYVNPARWKGHLEFKLDKRARKAAGTKPHASLPYTDMAAFMAELRERPSVAASALELVILTACRSNEALGARWEEVDLAARTWTIPASRMKGGKEHRVPLSDEAVAALTAQPSRSGLIFRGLAKNHVLSSVLRKIRSGVTVHGFRAAFKTWAEERTNVPSVAVEMSLAHVVGNAVENAYRRTDLIEHRRRLMHEWALYCSGATQ